MATARIDPIVPESFSRLDSTDPFFSTLRKSYAGFDKWLDRKASAGEIAYISRDAFSGLIIAMLYLKEESGVDSTICPSLSGRRQKIGTFKVDFEHHTSLGKRLLATALRKFAESECEYSYVTLFRNADTLALERLLNRYGFSEFGHKGDEVVLVKRRAEAPIVNPHASFPFVDLEHGNDYLLSIRPEFHVRMFGEISLQSERVIPVPDDVAINTIEKVYLSGSSDAQKLEAGDHIIIYRTSDQPGRAYYRAVASALCTITGVTNINDVRDEDSFLTLLKGRSVFDDSELDDFWNSRRYPWIISFLFNIPFSAYPNRKALLENDIISFDERIVCTPISKRSLKTVLGLGSIHEGYVVDQA